jgi:uncharacterized DUF497 family protein
MLAFELVREVQDADKPQRLPTGYAQHRLTFFGDGLSLELTESLRRTSLACAENQKKQAGIVDVLCGLYLQDPDEIKRHFSADFEGRVKQNFPSHRFGREGLFPKAVLEQLASDSGEAGFSFYLNYSDDVLRLLWLSRRLANAVGKKPSLMDVVAALGLDREWVEELSRSGFTPGHELADFDRDVRTVIFHATPHTGKEWPREMEFEFNSALGAVIQPRSDHAVRPVSARPRSSRETKWERRC